MIGVFVVFIFILIMLFWLICNLGEMLLCDLFKVGGWCVVEKCVLVVFGIVVLVWIFCFYWLVWIGMILVSDSIIVIVGVVLMFLVFDGDKEKLG